MDVATEVSKRLLKIDKALINRDVEMLDELFKLDSVDDVQEIRTILDDEPHIFASLCQNGFMSILEYLLGHLTVEINKKHNGMTGLQYACKEGHKDIVALLLSIGSQLNENVWEEQSEFYLASMRGHYEIIQLLLRQSPELVLDTSKCYCLFHGACKGGHVKMMQKWLRPDMDVNSEVAYVSSLNECENQFPLYAACEGNHYEAAEFLIGELKAQITRKICDAFPKFISKVVQNLFKTSDQGKSSFVMNSLDLECVQPVWFETTENYQRKRYSDIANEIQIDLSKNKITELPAKLLWDVPDIIDLRVSHNPLEKLPEPASNANLQINCLTSLDLSYCELTRLNYSIFCLQSLKKLIASHNKLEELYEQTDAQMKWKCKGLREIDLSHNRLQFLSQGIQECGDLQIICLSNNQLTSLCPPWQCPLKYLDISHNKINSFPPSADQFWSKTLKKLVASHNHLDQIPESVVKMKSMSHLDMSWNKISGTPHSSLWLCSLGSLNLSHNNLGSTMGRFGTTKAMFSFPGNSLKNSLTELDLSCNNLHSLPKGIFDAQSLSELNLNHNARLTSIPPDIGRLKNLILIGLKGIKFQDKEIQEIIKSMDDPDNTCSSASEFIKFMEKKRRKCRHHDVMKMIVFGCKNLGGYCLVKKLISEATGTDYRPHGPQHKSLEVADLTLRYSKKFDTACKRNIKFHIWEMPEIKLASTVYPCFLTQNSLYILIHDVSSLHEDIKKVSSQILAIQSCVTVPSILVIGLFPGAMDQEYKLNLQHNLTVTFISKFKCRFVSVTFSEKESWEKLRHAIHVTASAMKDASHRNSSVIQREVPESFITSYEKVKSLTLPIIDMEHFTQETGLKLSDFDDKIGDKLTLHEYLLQVGAMLHYDMQMSDLSSFVIIDPVWLFNLLSYFLENFVVGGKKQPMMPQEEVKKFMEGKIKEKFFQPFITILEICNIAIQIAEGKGKKSLLIPSLLSKNPPQFLANDFDDNSLSTSRFYPLPAIPASLWSHVISHLSTAIERYRDPTWKFKDLMRRPVYNPSESFKKAHRRSDIPSSEGILITAKTTNHGRCSNPSSNDVSSSNANLKKLAFVGIVKDVLEEVLEVFHPKLHGPIGNNSKPMALCPHCYKIKPGMGIIREEITHFYVRECAQRILWESFAFCKDTPVMLERLMPELLFLELPPNFIIAPTDVERSSVKLGHGMAGTVSKGTYKGKEVAIKVFHVPMYEPPYLDNEDELYPNVQNVLSSPGNSRVDEDKNDTEQRKISNAFSDIRQEVGILSKLKHKCIIAFIGVCVRRQVVLVMELAPFGSLRSQLEKVAPVQKIIGFEDETIINSSVFGKDLTYKMILQVASGLTYLHTHHIVFRDLKPDNILVMSMDVNAEINVKLSDYGISKFSTPQGVSGLIGTVAYMAPEVVAKQAYTDKIDIYSFGLVMFEILTGIPPAASDNHPMASQRNIKFEVAPSHTMKVTVNVNFLPLDHLMSDCWSYYIDNRPSAKEAFKLLKNVEFMIVHDALWFQPTAQELTITCVYTCKSLGRWTVWISESAVDTSVLKDRFISVYDMKSSRFTVWRKAIPGEKVTVMAKVQNKIWMVCENCNQLEEIVRGKENQFDIKPGQTLEDVPSTLLCHTLKPNNDQKGPEQSIVLVGQMNGNITTFSFSGSFNRAFTLITSLTLSPNNAVANIVAVREDLVIATCGFMVFSLDIQPQVISQDDDVHLLVSIKSTFSCFKELNVKEPILSLAAQGDAFWCIFKDTNLLMKLDCDSKEVLESVCITWDSLRDQIRVEQTGEPSPIFVEMHPQPSTAGQACSQNSNDDNVFQGSNAKKSSTLPSEKNKRNMYGTEDPSYLPSSREISAKAVSIENVQIEMGQSKSFNTNTSLSDSIEEEDNINQNCPDKKPPIPPRSRSNTDTSFDKNNTNHSLSRQNAMILPSDTPEDEENLYQNFTNNRPPIPPRSRSNTDGSFDRKNTPHSLPRQNALIPPSIPKNLSAPEAEVALTAMCLCSDLLAVGSSCGGFILIPVGINTNVQNRNQITFSSKSMQYPVLRHSKNKTITKKSAASLQKSLETSPKKGSIFHFVVAENKLVSFYKAEAEKNLKMRLSRRRALNRLCHNFNDGAEDYNTSTNTFTEVRTDLSNISDAPVTSSEMQIPEDGEEVTKLADIVIWDEVTNERLETIKSYGREVDD